MGTIRRMTTSVLSSFDWITKQLENHDALVSAALKDAENAEGRARVQLTRVRRDGESIRRILADLHLSDQLWRTRARECAARDRKRALECASRAKSIAQQIAAYEVRARDHQHLEEHMAEALASIQTRLGALRERRNVMRLRSSQADAARVLDLAPGSALGELDELFERWEERIAAYEPQSGRELSDAFEESFNKVEEQQALEAELASILGAEE
jgi:phage shock protein A